MTDLFGYSMQKDRSLVRTCVEEVSVSKICVRDHVRNRSDAKRMSSRFQKKKRQKKQTSRFLNMLYIIYNWELFTRNNLHHVMCVRTIDFTA